MNHLLGGTVSTAPVREYGKTEVHLDTSGKMFTNVSGDFCMLDEPYGLYFPACAGI